MYIHVVYKENIYICTCRDFHVKDCNDSNTYTRFHIPVAYICHRNILRSLRSGIMVIARSKAPNDTRARL